MSLALALAALLAGAAPAADLEGRWRLTLELPIEQDLPVVGAQRSHMRLTALVDLRDDDGQLSHRTHLCDLTITDGPPIARVHVPRRFVSTLGERRGEGALVGRRFALDFGEHLVGLAPGYTGPLPLDEGSAGVFDSDGDGRPAASLEVRVLGRGVLVMHVVQRLAIQLEGALWGDEIIGAALATRFEQRVLTTDPPVQALAGLPARISGPGRFLLQRVPGAAPACGTLSSAWHRRP